MGTLISKPLLIKYLKFIASSWAEDLLHQFKVMWILHPKRKYKTFENYLFYQFMDKNRSPLLTFRLYRILKQSLKSERELKHLITFLKANNLFSNLLKDPRNINIIALIIVLNIYAFKILPFTRRTFIYLKRKRNFSLKQLTEFMSLDKKNQLILYPDLFSDLILLRKEKISTYHASYVYKQYDILRTLKKQNLLPKINSTFKRNIIPYADFSDDDYDINSGTDSDDWSYKE